MADCKAWRYVWRITKEEYERRKLIKDDHCAHNSMEWAILTLTEDGMFACVSDYGDFVYYWGSHCRVPGQDFRVFVSQIEASYLLGKTRKREHINQEWSAEPLRLRVKALRECHNRWLKKKGDSWTYSSEWCDHGDFQHLDHEQHTAEWAKECLDLIDHLTPANLNELYYRLNLHFDGDDISYTYSPQAKTFGKYVLPQLQRLIKDELAAEQAQALEKAG